MTKEEVIEHIHGIQNIEELNYNHPITVRTG